jgi:orotate phosphoribosyltransferase-like protein
MLYYCQKGKDMEKYINESIELRKNGYTWAEIATFFNLKSATKIRELVLEVTEAER